MDAALRGDGNDGPSWCSLRSKRYCFTLVHTGCDKESALLLVVFVGHLGNGQTVVDNLVIVNETTWEVKNVDSDELCLERETMFWLANFLSLGDSALADRWSDLAQ